MDNGALSAVDSMVRVFACLLERASDFEAFEDRAMGARTDVRWTLENERYIIQT